MLMPDWWAVRRYGLCFDGGVASVPAWAPIGASAGDYRTFLEGAAPGDDAVHGPEGPLVEVLAHHRDRWDHITSFDDFLPLLTYDAFDPDAWASLAVDAGARYSTIVASHRDGWCWWDAPLASRSLADAGPRRNVVGEAAAACERHDLVLGVHLARPSAPDAPAADDALINQCRDLVQRYGVELLGGARPGASPLHASERLAHELDALTGGEPGPVTERSWLPGDAHRATVVTHGAMPAGILDQPWQLWRALGASMSRNGVEPGSVRMDARALVAELTEVVAKGGHLLIGVGPAADGSVPEDVQHTLREAGEWIRRHDDVVTASRPWSTWGDAGVRYVQIEGGLAVVDCAGRGRFAALGSDDLGVRRVELRDPATGPGGSIEVAFTHDVSGLQVDVRHSARTSPLPPVYLVEVEARERATAMFEVVDAAPQPLAPLLAGAGAGSIVQLGDGSYAGPATVPDGVVLRGLGGDRTTIVADDGPLALGVQSRLEHATVSRPTDATGWSASDEPPAVLLTGAHATVLGAVVRGTVVVTADDAVVRASAVTAVRTSGADRFTLSHCELTGSVATTALHLVGGEGHLVESNEFAGHPCAVHVVDGLDVVIRGNQVRAQWWGVRLERTERAHVHANLVTSTMRAVDVDSGGGAVVDGNAVFDGDSGCVLQRGAVDCEVSGNHWERCRIGLLCWDVDGVRRLDNHTVDLADPDGALVTGP